MDRLPPTVLFLFLLPKRAIGPCLNPCINRKLRQSMRVADAMGSVVVDIDIGIDIETTMQYCNAVTCLYWLFVAHADAVSILPCSAYALSPCFELILSLPPFLLLFVIILILILLLIRKGTEIAFPACPSARPIPVQTRYRKKSSRRKRSPTCD
jgi:hypothetical protein